MMSINQSNTVKRSLFEIPIDNKMIIFFLKENGQLAERRANEHFERLFETLQERKSEMLRSIEQSRNRRLDQLKGQVWNTRTEFHFYRLSSTYMHTSFYSLYSYL